MDNEVGVRLLVYTQIKSLRHHQRCARQSRVYRSRYMVKGQPVLLYSYLWIAGIGGAGLQLSKEKQNRSLVGVMNANETTTDSRKERI